MVRFLFIRLIRLCIVTIQKQFQHVNECVSICDQLSLSLVQFKLFMVLVELSAVVFYLITSFLFINFVPDFTKLVLLLLMRPLKLSFCFKSSYCLLNDGKNHDFEITHVQLDEFKCFCLISFFVQWQYVFFTLLNSDVILHRCFYSNARQQRRYRQRMTEKEIPFVFAVFAFGICVSYLSHFTAPRNSRNFVII